MSKLELVKEEDVLVEQKKSEFEPQDYMINLLKSNRDNIAQKLKDMGFKRFLFIHPKYGYKVDYFVNPDMVIMIDYHNTNIMTVEVLNKEEKEWILESIEEQLGKEELSNMSKFILLDE